MKDAKPAKPSTISAFQPQKGWCLNVCESVAKYVATPKKTLMFEGHKTGYSVSPWQSRQSHLATPGCPAVFSASKSNRAEAVHPPKTLRCQSNLLVPPLAAGRGTLRQFFMSQSHKPSQISKWVGLKPSKFGGWLWVGHVDYSRFWCLQKLDRSYIDHRSWPVLGTGKPLFALGKTWYGPFSGRKNCYFWRFPKMGVTPNHPFIDGNSMK